MAAPGIKAFIKAHVRIDPKFIDDFFGMHDLYTSPKSFLVDLGVSAKWLRTTKGNLKKTLVRSYVEGVDYQVSKPFRGQGTGGHGKAEAILLTPDCFKALCMMSRTPKAKQVREYYIAAEASFIEHRDQVGRAKDARIAELEANQRPTARPPDVKKGIIYIVKAHPTLSLYKIGKTVHEYNRMASHNRARADDVKPLITYETECVDRVEACMKLMLRGRQYRKRKEVYEITLPKLKELVENCDAACFSAMHRHKGARMDGGAFFAVVVKGG